MIEEIKEELTKGIIPFWESLRDDQYGGWYGYLDFDLHLDKRAEKGCILNSRITWFFSEAYLLLREESLLEQARHGFDFMRRYCLDPVEGGVFWSVTYDGKPLDTTKHTYNQAFAVYALSTYYEASGDPKALALADILFTEIEGRMRDEGGYLEAFDREFFPVSNEKLSENGVVATRTMNTILHVLEAYTQYYKVSGKREVHDRLCEILDIMAHKIYDPEKKRLGVFFDHEYNSLIDLYSYGHDIETAWLTDRAVEVLGEESYIRKMTPITQTLAAQIYKEAFDGHSIPVECERGVVKQDRVWWVQAEAINGFVNAWQMAQRYPEYVQDVDPHCFLAAAGRIWAFVRDFLIDPRRGSEWFWYVSADGKTKSADPIVEPWKCPYHNGRMCVEVIRRGVDYGSQSRDPVQWRDAEAGQARVS